jgi:hypothetical protein
MAAVGVGVFAAEGDSRFLTRILTCLPQLM